MKRRIGLMMGMIAAVCGASLASGASPSHTQRADDGAAKRSDLSIVEAWYGDPQGPGGDVTSIITTIFQRGDIDMPVSNLVLGDRASGHHKALYLKYRVKGTERVKTFEEGSLLRFDSLLVSQAKVSYPFTVLSAVYSGVNVTRQVVSQIEGGASSIHVDSGNFQIQDPAPGVRKMLILSVKLADGTTRELRGMDGDSIALSSLKPLKKFATLSNGSFMSLNPDDFVSDQNYVPASQFALTSQGTCTIAEGILRPYQLHQAIRADFVEHTGRDGSMALWVNPIPGRQPVLLWEQKVAVEPDSDYQFSCWVADISDSENLYVTVVLDVDGVKSKPKLISYLFKWTPIVTKLHTGNKTEAVLKIWRDVLPYDADGAAALGVDDISFVPIGR